MLLDRELIDAEELAAGHSRRSGTPLKRGRFSLADVPRVMVRGSFGRQSAAPALFAAAIASARGTYTPRRTRGCRATPAGRTGIIERIQGCHVFPDTVAVEAGEQY